MPHSYLKRITDVLQSNGGKATLTEIEQKLALPAEKVLEIVKSSNGVLKRCHIGRTSGIAYVGSELGARGSVHLYTDVRRVLASTWAKARGMRAAVVIDTSLNGGARSGTWSRPDCVMVSFPARRADLHQPATLSSFEIEAPEAFGIQSIYEAHAHGRGADYSWVVFVRTNEIATQEFERIRWAAKACGIGIIACANCGNHATWDIIRNATRREDNYRKEFIATAIPEKHRWIADCSLESLAALSGAKTRPNRTKIGKPDEISQEVSFSGEPVAQSASPKEV